MEDTNLIKGDDSQAFGQNLIRITLNDPDGLLNNHSISKCEIRFNGCLSITIDKPVFPLLVNLTSEQSKKLTVGNNTAALAIWDELGRKLTAEGGKIVVVGGQRV